MKGTDTAPRYFATAATFRIWLERHHATERDLLVGFHKRDSGRPSMTWPESVDQALAFGWIDGVRKRVDDERYTIRFTPRRPTSIWSRINIDRVTELTKQGLMTPPGLAAFAHRREAKSRIYCYEQSAEAVLDAAHLKAFKARRKAWAFFEAQPPSYRRQMTFRITSAKKPETREKRLQLLIGASAEGRRL